MLPVRKFDLHFFLPVVCLLGVSVISLASISPENLDSHLLYIFLSLFFFFLFSFLDLEIFLPFSPLIYVFCLFFLFSPFIAGVVVRGSVRWVTIGNLTFQPSEIVKPFLALFCAWYWSKKEFSLKSLFLIGILFIFPLILIFLQPDLGSTLAVLSIFIGSLFTLPFETKHIVVLLVLCIIILPLVWFSMADYQRLRIRHFLDPNLDPLGKGYNLIQAKIAVGSGELLGQGLGQGSQSHLTFLPERYTDFIFASFAEETGLVGSFLLILLYFWLFNRILKIASNLVSNSSSERPFFTLTMGIFFYLFFQVIINISMNIGLAPITGITLPLFSYGGSSLLTTLISLGILESIANKTKQEKVIEIG